MRINTKDMTLVALFAALTAVGGIIPGIPIGPAPITLQTFFTALAGIVLGARLGMLSQLVYVIVGLAGAPIFSGLHGGPSVIYGPTFGYLIGFIIGAYVIGKIAESSEKTNFIRLFIAIIIGYIIIYAIGIPYMYMIINNVMGVHMSFYSSMKLGLFVFIPGDLSKCVLCSVVGVKVIPIIKKQMVKSNKSLSSRV